MAHETEIKLRVNDLKEFVRALKKLRARRILGGTGRVHESNVLFDTPNKALAGRGELLRIRTETREKVPGKRSGSKVERVVLTFKRPVEPTVNEDRSPRGSLPGQRHKVREEIELEVGEAFGLTKIFEGLGLRGWFRYEKFRTTYRLPTSQRWAHGLLIEVDETPIGTFAELEGPPKAIDQAAQEMGFSERDYILTNYLTLYREQCARRGEPLGDMLFWNESERVGASRRKKII